MNTLNFSLVFYIIIALNVNCFHLSNLKQSIIRHVSLRSQTDVINRQESLSTDEGVLVITENAMKQLINTQSSQQKAALRIGVKSGGCSGMSYKMDFIDESDITDSDHIEKFGTVKCVIDPKSLLFLYGLELDYSNELMGGGFKFGNPNAKSSCGCGKSFGV